MKDLERRLGHTIAELHAIATRALAHGDAYERGLLREQLEREEFGEPSDNQQDPLETWSGGADLSPLGTLQVKR